MEPISCSLGLATCTIAGVAISIPIAAIAALVGIPICGMLGIAAIGLPVLGIGLPLCGVTVIGGGALALGLPICGASAIALPLCGASGVGLSTCAAALAGIPVCGAGAVGLPLCVGIPTCGSIIASLGAVGCTGAGGLGSVLAMLMGTGALSTLAPCCGATTGMMSYLTMDAFGVMADMAVGI